MAKALGDLNYRFSLNAMYDSPSDLQTKYIAEENYASFNGNKLRFAYSSFRKGLASRTVILSHINLLLFAWLIKKFSPKTKIILFAHGIEIWKPLSTWKKRFLQKETEIWAVSEYTANTLVSMHQIARHQIKIVNNCLDPYFELPNTFEKPTNLLERFKLTKEQPTLFTLTRLSFQESYKGYDRVLMVMPRLLKKFPTLHYILAGKADALELERVKAIISELNLEQHVSLVGFVADNELTAFFRLGSVFVMPSTKEGFGIVFIEAAACGAKVIAGNADGSVDALLNGKLGTLVDPESIAEIEQAIENELTSYHEPKKIQNSCLANFSYQQYVNKIQKELN